MNLFAARRTDTGFVLQGQMAVERHLPPQAGADLPAGLRAGARDVEPRPGHLGLPGVVKLAEISGSDTFVHAETAAGNVVAQLPGVHRPMPSALMGRCWPRRASLPARGRLPDGPDRAGPLAFLRGRSQDRRGLRAAAAEVHLPRRRRLCLAGPVRLRQDHAAQLRVGPAAPVAWPHPVRWAGRHRQDAAGAQYRPGVPVSGRVRHHDGGRKPGIPVAQPRDCAGPHSRAGGPHRRNAGDVRSAGPPRQRPDRRRQAEDLAGARPGAQRRVGHPVR
ncbi:hypothetical protein G6F22_015824 [Rhizopus arrhizus]|nr:hypothetical protein G6F22_015824 [Rhizopus arrhizus]